MPVCMNSSKSGDMTGVDLRPSEKAALWFGKSFELGEDLKLRENSGTEVVGHEERGFLP